MASHPLTDAERAQLSVRADQFHEALARGTVNDWGPYLAGLEEQRLRPAVLAELVILDLIHRWEHGQRPHVEDYIARFPEFGPADRVPPQVIVEEWRCRLKAGELPDPAEYQRRFPQQFPGIRAELEGLRDRTRTGTPADTALSTLDPGGGGTAVTGDDRAATGDNLAAADYEFIRILGRGVFGEVWLARKKTSGIEKAIKILHQSSNRDAAHRERRGLELIKNLRHPYLLATEDFWVSGGRLHVVMELADGTLRGRLQQCQAHGLAGIPADELLGYLREAAEGLDFLHARHVVHRDIKPDNILLLHGHAKVADFGLARYQQEVLAPTGSFAGTPAYMAPEAWGREGGPASDQYSLAVTYTELRQGQLPLRPGGLAEMLAAQAAGDFAFGDIIGAEERAVLRRALSAEPEHRYPTCRAFAEALAHALAHRSERVPHGLPHGLPPGTVDTEGKRDRSAAADRVARDTPLAPPDTPRPSATRDEPTDSSRAGRTPSDGRPVRVSGRLLLVSGLLLILSLLAAATAIGLRSWWQTTDRTDGVPLPLPDRAVPTPDARVVTLADGRKLPDRISVPVGAEVVRFRLVTGGSGPRPVEPFYVLESKVSNKLFRSGGGQPPPESERNGPEAPVTHLTAEEAAAFAARVFGGRLPTPDEWDHAAGLYSVTDRAEVTLPGGRPRVGIPRPEPTGEDDSGPDVNEFGLRDMAGNGREWTRATLAGQKLVGVHPLEADDLVILRGRCFSHSRGLTFAQLVEEQTTPQTQYAGVRSPYTGFRVVLPAPAR